MSRYADYIVYDKETDFPVCLGTAAECSKVLGVSIKTFQTLVSRTKYKTTPRYEVYNIDKLLEDYDEEKIFGYKS